MLYLFTYFSLLSIHIFCVHLFKYIFVKKIFIGVKLLILNGNFYLDLYINPSLIWSFLYFESLFYTQRVFFFCAPQKGTMEEGIKVPFAENAELFIVLHQECSLTTISAFSTHLTLYS